MWHRYAVSDRLEHMASESRPTHIPIPSGTRADAMPSITALLTGHHLAEYLHLQLSSAGLPIRPSEFVGIMAGLGIAGMTLALLLLKDLVVGIVCGLVGIVIPILVLKHLQNSRRTAFAGQIVDTLSMLASSLRAGFSLLRAMQVVAQEMPAPISEEFHRAVNEMAIGRTLEDALKGIVARVQSYDFDLAVTAILIQVQVGGDLADILDIIAETIRERTRIINEMKALTAEGKLSGIILVLLPIFLGTALSILNPSYMSVLLVEPIGHLLIAIAVVLQIIGGYIINRMMILDI